MKLKQVIDACRNLRGEMNISPAQKVPLLVLGETAFFESSRSYIEALSKLSELKVYESEDEFDTATKGAPVSIAGN
ncbi:hypothetical protein ABTC05_19080, partial [Acinetobacter baumannii]